MSADLGGHKEYKRIDITGTYANQTFTGPSSSVIIDLVHDWESPEHCAREDFTCEKQGDVPDPEPIFAYSDATTVSPECVVAVVIIDIHL